MASGRDSPAVEALTFDCFGTLIDWERGIREALVEETLFESVRPRWDELIAFRGKKEAEWEALPYRHYREILAASMREAFAHVGAALDEPTALRIADSLRAWPPFPDTVSALRRLGSRFPLAILSNVDRAPMHEVIERLGVPFAEIVTAEDVRSYKPAPAHFLEARRRLGGRSAGQLHVGASLFHDIEPAQKLGIACAWINRRGERLTDGLAPKHVAKDLLELCQKLGA